MNLDEWSYKISKDFEDIDIQAKNLLKIMICGSYKKEQDKQILLDFKKELNELGISGVFVMEDIKTKEELSFPVKFELIWQKMNEDCNFPLFILYAGESAPISTGLNSEIQDIAKDGKKLDCAHLFTIPKNQLTGYVDRFMNYHEIKDKTEFICKATRVIKAKLELIKNFLIYKRGKKK